MEQQPLAGSHREDYEKLQGNVAKVAGSLRQVPVEVEELRSEVFCGWLFGNVWHGFLYHKTSKTFKNNMYVIYSNTVCTNISNYLFWGGDSSCQTEFSKPNKNPQNESQLRRPEQNWKSSSDNAMKSRPKESRPPKRVQSVHSHPVEGSNLFKTIGRLTGAMDTCVG